MHQVQYKLHPTFSKDVRFLHRSTKTPTCRLTIWTWGLFEVEPVIEDADGLGLVEGRREQGVVGEQVYLSRQSLGGLEDSLFGSRFEEREFGSGALEEVLDAGVQFFADQWGAASKHRWRRRRKALHCSQASDGGVEVRDGADEQARDQTERHRRRITIGPDGLLTPDQARDQAMILMGKILQGEDPLQERQEASAAPTVDEWMDSYLEDVKRRKKSWREDKRFLGWSKKRWNGRRLDSQTTEELRQAFAIFGETHSPIQANRWLASVRACLAAAWRSDLILSNPAAKLRKNPEPLPRTRVLSDKELKATWEAILALDDLFAQIALVMLVHTGARLSEVLRARWDDFDLDGRVWRLPAPKAGRPQLLPLTPELVEFLEEAPRSTGPYLVPGRNPEKPRYDIKNAWETVRKAAKIEDVRLHDIRRTYGLAVARTVGLHHASKLLRHSDIKVTESVYAPLGFDELAEAQERVERSRSNVLPFRRAE